MPSTATITAFYSFTANTKARATQVNNNFDVFRGHFIPIHASTQTSANNTYDLGSTEYRWRSGYFQSVDFQSNTTTGQALNLSGETSAASPAFVFKIAGSEVSRIGNLGQTTAAGAGQIAVSNLASTTSFNTSATPATIASISLTTKGRPIHLGFQSSYFGLTSFTTTGHAPTVRLYRNGTATIYAFQHTSRTVAASDDMQVFFPDVTIMETTVGANAFDLRIVQALTATVTIINGRLWAKEIL